MLRPVALLLLLAAVAGLPTRPTVPNQTLNGCACDLYDDPDCPEARVEFICMSGCIQKGYVFPECDTVLGCCLYLESQEAAVSCIDHGSYVTFECGPTEPTNATKPATNATVWPLGLTRQVTRH
jgi:hypothetical protein